MAIDFPSGSVPRSLGRYVVRQVIGRGSMGAVLLAKDPAIDRTVAIKLVQTSVQLTKTELEKYTERFYREAKAAGKLLHPNIVTVFDFGHSEDGTPFIVMEYVEGRTLKELIETEPLALEDALQIAQELLDALGYAHSQGVIHRDIKPANILITKDRHAKITDFGIAHLVGSEFTQTDELLGTPYYMAPEQIEKKKIDRRTDLFSFGVVFYQMLTGKRPFTGDSFASVSYSILKETPVPPDQINSNVSPALSRIILRFLGKEPSGRFASAEEAKQSLISLESKGFLLPDSEMEIETLPQSALLEEPKQRFRIAWILVVFLCLTLPVLFYFLIRQDKNVEEIKAVPTVNAPVKHVPSGLPEEERLFSEAKKAFEEQKLDESKAKLEEILKKNPEFFEASELLEQITVLRLKEKLPISFYCKHNHRIGYCKGKLILADGKIEYGSEDHGLWRWTFRQIRSMKRIDSRHLSIETYEKDYLKFGEYKRYNFSSLSESLKSEDWAQYRKLRSQ